MKYWTSTVLALSAAFLVIAVHQLYTLGLQESYPVFMLVAITFLFYQYLKKKEKEAEEKNSRG